MLSIIQYEVAFIGNNTNRVANSSVHDFTITKTFKVNLNPPKAPKIVEVVWLPPTNGWLKSNTDVSFDISEASSGRLFHNDSGDSIFAFSSWWMGIFLFTRSCLVW